jgi:hypothetical protein
MKLFNGNNTARGLNLKNWNRLAFFSAATVTIMVTMATMTFSSCRSTKKIQTAISKKDTVIVEKTVPPDVDPRADSIRFINDVYARLQAQRIHFNTFSAKVKVNYEGSDGKDYEFNAFIRIQKDHMIWVSINALLGIEAFRAIITPDSVKVINKLDKIVQLRSVSYLKEVAHLPFDFNTLQELIVGNPIYLDSNIIFYNKNDNGISIMSVGQLFKNYITLNGNDYTLKHSKLDDVDVLRARTCDLTYGDYERRDTIRFSTYRKISVAEKSKLDIQLGFKQFNFNEPLSFPFSIPKNYKRK